MFILKLAMDPSVAWLIFRTQEELIIINSSSALCKAIWFRCSCFQLQHTGSSPILNNWLIYFSERKPTGVQNSLHSKSMCDFKIYLSWIINLYSSNLLFPISWKLQTNQKVVEVTSINSTAPPKKWKKQISYLFQTTNTAWNLRIWIW